jgi:hypothetical protein
MQEQETLNHSPSKGPSERLLQGMSAEERDKFIRSYNRAKTVLNRINQFASKEVNRQSSLIDSPKGFEVPNWPYLQAWYAGYRQAMRVTKDLTRTK